MYVLLVFLFLQLTSKCSDGCLQPARHRQCCVGTPVHSGGLASARGSTHVLGRHQGGGLLHSGTDEQIGRLQR